MVKSRRSSVALRFLAGVFFAVVSFSAVIFGETFVAQADVDSKGDAVKDARSGENVNGAESPANKQDVSAAVTRVLKRANALASQGHAREAYDLVLAEWQRFRKFNDPAAFAAVQSDLLRDLETYGEQLPSARRARARDLDVRIPLLVE